MKTNKPDFGKWQKLSPNVGPKYFFRGFYFCQMFDIVASIIVFNFYDPDSKEIAKKTIFRLDLSPLGPNSGHQKSFKIVAVSNFKEN